MSLCVFGKEKLQNKYQSFIKLIDVSNVTRCFKTRQDFKWHNLKK